MQDINSYASELLDKFAAAFKKELKRILRKNFNDQSHTQGVLKHLKKEQQAVEEIYSYNLEHFWQIINGNWKLFKGYFQTKPRTKVYLEEITELRNHLSHRRGSHVLQKQNLKRIIENCSNLLSAIKSPTSDEFADVVVSLAAANPPWGKPLSGHLPPSDQIYNEFVGRPEELKKLSEWLDSDDSQVSVRGYGGSGKSTLAHRFAQTVKEGLTKDDLAAVGWISAKKSAYHEGKVIKVIRQSTDFEDMHSVVMAIWFALFDSPHPEAAKKPPSPLDELLEGLLKDLLPMLLVVDDFDTISEDETLSEFLLHGLKNTPIRVIYTSRHHIEGIKNLEVPHFNEKELEDFVSKRSEAYGADINNSRSYSKQVKNVTDGNPLFVEDLIYHAQIAGAKKALSDWRQQPGDVVREYALQKQVQRLGHSSPDLLSVLLTLAISSQALIPIEIKRVTELKDDDVEAALRKLLHWQMVNKVTVDGSPYPAYKMHDNTCRFVHQIYQKSEENKIKTIDASLRSLSDKPVSEAQTFAIGRTIAQAKELAANDSLGSAISFLEENMKGDLADSPDIHGFLGRLYSAQEPLDSSSYEKATTAFKHSHDLGSLKTDTYYHWLGMEQKVAEEMIKTSQERRLPDDNIALQWQKCKEKAELGIDRCGNSQLLCYHAGYAASRAAKLREQDQNFAHAQDLYEQSKNRFEKALTSTENVVKVWKIHRGLTLAYEGLENLPRLRRHLLLWIDLSEPTTQLQKDQLQKDQLQKDQLQKDQLQKDQLQKACRHLAKKYPSLRDIPDPKLQKLLHGDSFSSEIKK